MHNVNTKATEVRAFLGNALDRYCQFWEAKANHDTETYTMRKYNLRSVGFGPDIDPAVHTLTDDERVEAERPAVEKYKPMADSIDSLLYELFSDERGIPLDESDPTTFADFMDKWCDNRVADRKSRAEFGKMIDGLKRRAAAHTEPEAGA